MVFAPVNHLFPTPFPRPRSTFTTPFSLPLPLSPLLPPLPLLHRHERPLSPLLYPPQLSPTSRPPNRHARLRRHPCLPHHHAQDHSQLPIRLLHQRRPHKWHHLFTPHLRQPPWPQRAAESAHVQETHWSKYMAEYGARNHYVEGG